MAGREERLRHIVVTDGQRSLADESMPCTDLSKRLRRRMRKIKMLTSLHENAGVGWTGGRVERLVPCDGKLTVLSRDMGELTARAYSISFAASL